MGLDESQPARSARQPATKTDELSKLQIHCSSLLVMIVPLAGSCSGGKHETGARVSAGDATRVLGQSGEAAMGYNIIGTPPRIRPSRGTRLTFGL
jgi:hypothetical protein